MKNKEYLILETLYKNMCQDLDIFPDEWYNVMEYDLKIKILKEFIKNKILIKNSINYYNFKLKALGEIV